MASHLKINHNTIPSGLLAVQKNIRNIRVLAVQRAMEMVRSEIIKPVNFPVVTGRLKLSIAGYAQITTNGKTYTNQAIFKTKAENTKVTGKVGTNVSYAKSVEYTSKKHPGYFRKGVRRAKPMLLPILKNTLKQGLHK